MTSRVLPVALEGLQERARAKARLDPDVTGKAFTRLVAVFYYPRSKRFAYQGREGRISRHTALEELRKEVLHG